MLPLELVEEVTSQTQDHDVGYPAKASEQAYATTSAMYVCVYVHVCVALLMYEMIFNMCNIQKAITVLLKVKGHVESLQVLWKRKIVMCQKFKRGLNCHVWGR